MSSIEEVKARLIQLAQDVPIDLFNKANNDLMDITDEMKVLIAGTNNSELEQALGRLEQGNSLTVDGAVAIVEARDEVWRAAERL